MQPSVLADPKMTADATATRAVLIGKVTGRDVSAEADVLAIEEPLEIRLGYGSRSGRTHRAVSVTMRSPGQDFDLAAGFLFTEGILGSPEQMEEIRSCGPVQVGGHRNVVRVEMRSDLNVDLARLERHFFTTSSCGICGKTSLEAVRVGRRAVIPPRRGWIDPNIIHRLPEPLRAAQATFDRTGGLHAAGLFTEDGSLVNLREDVGRHNAVDKLIGSEFRAGRLPLNHCILLLSGRASFELVQKAMMAGIPLLAAVGAPSSLAVELARDCGMTVLGFVREGHFNIYSGAERIRGTTSLSMPPNDGKPDNRGA